MIPLATCSILPKLLKFKYPGQFPKGHLEKLQRLNLDLKQHCLESDTDAEFSSVESNISCSDCTTLESSFSTDDAIVMEYSCPICLEVMVEPATFMCGHSGCIGCLRSVHYCPVCRHEVPPNTDLNVNIGFRSAIANILVDHPEFQRRLEVYRQSQKYGSARLMIESAKHGIEIVDHPLCAVMGQIVRAARNMHTRLSHKLTLPTDPEYINHTTFACFGQSYMTNSVKQLLINSPEPVVYCPEEITPGISCRLDSTWTNVDPICCCDIMVRSLMRRALILADESAAYDATRTHARTLVSSMIRTALMSAEASQTPLQDKRVVITCDHMLASLKTHNAAVYGYGGPGGLRYLLAPSIYQVWYAVGAVHPPMMLNTIGCSVIHDLITEFLSTLAGHITHTTKNHANTTPQELHVLQVRVGAPSDHYSVPIAVAVNRRRHANTSGVAITAHSMEYQMRHLLTGKILESGCSEGAAALARFMHTDPEGDSVATGKMSKSAGLKFIPEHIAMCLNRLGGHVLTAGGAVYLTGVCEYLVAILLASAEDMAGAFGDETLTCRHLSLAIRLNGELSALFPGCVRQGGVVPSNPCEFSGGETFPMQPPALVAYDRMIRTLGRASPSGIIIDPLSGAHVCGHSGSIVEELDAACASSVFERADMATALLSDKHKKVVEAARNCPSMPRYTLGKIRMLQRCTSPIIDWSCFTRFVYELTAEVMATQPAVCSSDVVEAIYTSEAIGALLTSVENHFHELFTLAYNQSCSRTLKTQNVVSAVEEMRGRQNLG